MSVSKRGVSTIVATVILILITLVAIFLLWFFLRPTISTTGEKLGTAADCINVRVEPVSCKYYRSAGCNQTMVSLNTRRAAGSGYYNGLQFLFAKQDGSPFYADNKNFTLGFNGSLAETQYGVYSGFFNRTNLPFENPLNSFNVAVLVGRDKRVCNSLAVQIPCRETLQVNVGGADCNKDGVLDQFDYLCFVNNFNKNETGKDYNNDGVYDIDDFFSFCSTYDTGNKG